MKIFFKQHIKTIKENKKGNKKMRNFASATSPQSRILTSFCCVFVVLYKIIISQYIENKRVKRY